MASTRKGSGTAGGAADRDLALGHDLEQRRLHLGRRAVDLVGEHEVGEHRAQLDVEGLGGAAVDAGADDVGGHQVGGELDAGEGAADDRGEGLDRERLGQAGHALEQHVAPGEQADEEALDGPVLADDDLLDLEERLLEQGGLGRAIGGGGAGLEGHAVLLGGRHGSGRGGGGHGRDKTTSNRRAR